MLKAFTKAKDAVVDLGMVIVIGLAFVGMTVVAYIVYTVHGQLVSDGVGLWGETNRTMTNITVGFDNAINLILIAITIFILALAISALYFIRRK